MTSNSYETPKLGIGQFPPNRTVVSLGGAILSAGAYLLAIFAGTALHAAKNGVGDGTMPSLTLSLALVVVGAALMAVGFALTRTWLVNPNDPVSSFEVFSVLICDVVPLVIGIYYLARGRSRGARLLLIHALILFIKFAVIALVWNPNL